MYFLVLTVFFFLQTAHFIRCVMPNAKKSPTKWSDKLVINQVRYLGLVENTRVRRAGYPYRMKYDRFEWRSEINRSQNFTMHIIISFDWLSNCMMMLTM